MPSAGQLTIVKPDGTSTSRPLDGEPSLELLRNAVGGYLEVVPGFTTVETADGVEPCIVFCDEEGKLKNCEVNVGATVEWNRALRRAGHHGLIDAFGQMTDHLVGNIAIITGDKVLRAMQSP